MTRISNLKRYLTAVLLSACITTTLAEPPSGYGGGGHSPIPKGVKYAGPIVYTNEKPPIIHFPPPPRGAGLGGWGKGPQQIKYIPMPHHDLPILIYQSDTNPPIHVVSPPQSSSAQEYGPPQQDSYGPPSKIESSPPKDEFVPPTSSSYSSGGESSSYNAPTSYGPPSTSSGSNEGGGYSSSFGSNGGGGYSSSSGSNGGGYSSAQASYGVPSSGYGSPPLYGSPSGPRPGGYGPPKVMTYSGRGHASSSEWLPGPPPGGKGGWGPPPPSMRGWGPPPPPPKKASPPAPHIIYTGHPPIHILQKASSAPKEWSWGPSSYSSSVSHGPSNGNSFGNSLSSFYGAPEMSVSHGPPRQSYGGGGYSSFSGSNGGGYMSSSQPANFQVSYGAPSYSRGSKMVSISYGPPKHTPSFMYGPPPLSGPSDSHHGGPPYDSFDAPKGSLSSTYDAPQGNSISEPSSYGAPSNELSSSSQSSSYGAPSSSSQSSSYGAPSSSFQSSSYGAPSSSSQSSSYGAPSSSSQSSSYGAPSSPSFSSSYGAPSSSSFSSSPSFYGPPKTGGFLSSMMQSFAPMDFSYGQRNNYGPPKTHYGPPRMSYGPPKQRSKYSIAPKAWHKPPIIIYAGIKPPVHVYKTPQGGWDSSSASSSASTALTTTTITDSKDSTSSDGGRIVSSSNGPDFSSSYQSSSNNNNIDISYGGSSSNGEIYLPSASAPRPTIIKPLTQQALKTIYVSSSVGSEGPFKTYLVTNSNPVQVQNIGFTNPKTRLPPVDLDTAASYNILSYLPPPKRLQTPIESQESFVSQPAAESRILPSNPESIFQDFKSDESSVENASISVPLSLIVSTSSSVESSENNSST